MALLLALVGTATATNAFDGGAESAKKKKVKRGPAGPPGPIGPTGPTGPAGTAGSPAASMLTGRTVGNLPTGAGDYFLEPSGSSTFSTVSTDLTHLTPNATVVARDLSVEIDVGAGVGGVHTITLMDDGSPTSLTCSTVGSGDTDCETGAGVTATIGPGSLIALRVTVSGAVNATPMEFGWRAVTP